MPSGQANPAFRYIRRVAGMLDSQNVADRELLARFVTAQDELAFTLLIHRHGPMVLGVCLRILHHRQDAEDAFQATFLALFRMASSLRSRESVGGWLHCVACRIAQKTRVATARRRKHEKNIPTPQPTDPTDELTVREASQILDEELVRLPNKFRLPLVLCYLEGLSRDEAAEQLGWSVGTLKSRLEQARERLSARLSARGLARPAALGSVLFLSVTAPAAVSAALTDSAVRVVFTAGATGNAVSAPVTAFAEGVRAMSLTRLKIVTVVLIGAGLSIWAAVGVRAVAPPGYEAPAGNAPTAKASEPKVNLAKIDRTIAKEPPYKSKKPKYCLLAFGPEAKTHVWLVHDGDTLYVDRNGNGDLTEKGERVESTDGMVWLEDAAGNRENRRANRANDTLGLNVRFKAGTITERDGKTKHTLWVGFPSKDDDGYFVGAAVDGKYLQMTDQPLQFADRPKDAPIVHLNGPLSIHRFPPWSTKYAPFVRGNESNQLLICIGTDGIGKFSQAWLNPFRGVPEDIHPIADIEFPSKKPGGKSIQVRLPLTKRESGNNLFYAPLQIPDEAADGKAKVIVHFSDWKGSKVIPATFDMTVESPKKAVKP